jgi:hypothetical protein
VVTVERDALMAVLTEAQIPAKVCGRPAGFAISRPFYARHVGRRRVALACGAWANSPGEDVLVVSAGTCITYKTSSCGQAPSAAAPLSGIPNAAAGDASFTGCAIEVIHQRRHAGYWLWTQRTSLAAAQCLGAVAGRVDGDVAQFTASMRTKKSFYGR